MNDIRLEKNVKELYFKMTEKEINKVLATFYNCNSKRMIVRNYSKEEAYAFEIIKQYYKNEEKFKGKSYNGIYYNSKRDQLKGEEWLNILKKSKNLEEYFRIIRSDYSYCNRRLLATNLNYNIKLWFYFNKKNKQEIIIKATENIYNSALETELEYLKKYIKNGDNLNMYFFELQKVVQKEIMIFTNWVGNNFKFKTYANKIKEKIANETIYQQLMEKIIMVNNFRNSISKVTAGSSEINIQIRQKWDNSSNDEKEIICWEMFYIALQILTILNIKNKTK